MELFAKSCVGHFIAVSLRPLFLIGGPSWTIAVL